MFNLNPSDIILLLDYGIIGFGVMQALLMYNLLGSVQKKEKLDNKLLDILIFYFSLSISIFLLGSSIKVAEFFKKPSVSIEINPTDPSFWAEDPENSRWFNAQYSLAKEEFIQLNAAKIENDVRFQLLCFTGRDLVSKANSKDKFDRMRVFLKRLSEETVLNDQNTQVRMVPKSRMPSISFFTTVREGEPVIIYYLEELVQADGVPTIAFEVKHEMVVKFFETEFAQFWHTAVPIPLYELTNEAIETDSILTRFQ